MRVVLELAEHERSYFEDWLTCLGAAPVGLPATIQLTYTQGDEVIQGEFAIVERPVLEDD